MNQDRRQHARLEQLAASAVVLARHNRGVSVVIENISIGGVCLVGPLALATGETIQILFELEGHPIDVQGEVVRVNRQDILTDRVSVAFKHLSDCNLELIRRLVEAAS